MFIIDFVQRKYKSEIGESMEKPKEKLKKIFIIMGITGAVYAGFQYLLPLVIPFFAAYATAVLLEPSAKWIQRKLTIFRGSRAVRIPIELIGGGELVVLFGLLGTGLYVAGRRLLVQTELFFQALPELIRQFDVWLTGCCRVAEKMLHLRPDYMVRLVQNMLRDLGESVKTAAMPYLMVSSVSMVQWIAGGMVVILVLFLASVLTLGKLDEIRKFENQSLFREEFRIIHEKFRAFGKTYVRVQAVILLLTTGVCIGGLFLLKNPYYMLLGTGIGLLDALPLFGTGTALIPWAAAEALGGRGGRAAALIGIYVVCYLLRQILEAKLMAKGIGLSALETLAALYIGLRLFGIWGVLLGPAALMLIKALLEIADGPSEKI